MRFPSRGGVSIVCRYSRYGSKETTRPNHSARIMRIASREAGGMRPHRYHLIPLSTYNRHCLCVGPGAKTSLLLAPDYLLYCGIILINTHCCAARNVALVPTEFMGNQRLVHPDHAPRHIQVGLVLHSLWRSVVVVMTAPVRLREGVEVLQTKIQPLWHCKSWSTPTSMSDTL